MKLKTLFNHGIRICSAPKCKRETCEGSKFCSQHTWGRAIIPPKNYDGLRPNNGYSKFGGI